MNGWVYLTADWVKDLLDDIKKNGLKIDIRLGKPQEWLNKGPAGGFLIDDKIALAIGLVIKDKVGEVWMVPGSLFYKHLKICYTAIKEIVSWAIQVYDIQVFQALAGEDENKSQSFLFHFDFLPVEVIEKEGKKYIVYARWKNGCTNVGNGGNLDGLPNIGGKNC